MARSGVVVAAVAAVLVAVCGVAAAEDPPNVVFILVDDLGWNDLSMMGSKDVKSPNIDALMQAGVRFENGYAPISFGASRKGIFTGIHPMHMGIQKQSADDFEDTLHGIPLQYERLGDMMKRQGYANKVVGKWDMGYTGEHHPMNSGFDSFFGFLGNRFWYTRDERLYKPKDGGYFQKLYDDWRIWTGATYLTVDFTDKAIEYITEKKDERFFLYLPYNAPHSPYEYLPEDVDETKVSPERVPHVAMIHTLDREIGRLIQHLEDLQLTEKTVVIFASDSGGHRNGSRNKPLNFFKHSVFEGGIRVHFSMKWPGKIKPGQTYQKLVSLIDIFPTLEAVSQVPYNKRNPEVEGRNLLPFVTMVGQTKPKNKGLPHDFLCVRDAKGEGVIRQGKWKLWSVNGTMTHLYNLNTDIGETTDRLAKKPAVAQRLLALYEQWDSLTLPILYPSEVTPNPLTVEIRKSPASASVGEALEFTAKGWSDLGRKSPKFMWEVFRRKDTVYAQFNKIKNTAGVTISKRGNRFTTITFSKAGTWVVRINITDGRFLKWTDMTYNVSA